MHKGLGQLRVGLVLGRHPARDVRLCPRRAECCAWSVTAHHDWVDASVCAAHTLWVCLLLLLTV